MLTKVTRIPPAIRAVIATFAATAGVTLSGDDSLDFVIFLFWLIGGAAEIIRDLRVQALSAEDVSRKLQEAADKAAKGGGPLALLAAAAPFLFACGAGQSSDLAVLSARATCEAEVVFEREGIPIGVLVRPSIVEGSGGTAVVCVSYGPFVFCEDALSLSE